MNRILYAEDCLDVLNNEYALLDGSVDLIYLDPPFNSKSTYNLPFKGKYKKDVKPVEAFTDTWTWGEKEREHLSKLKKGGGGRERFGRYCEPNPDHNKREKKCQQSISLHTEHGYSPASYEAGFKRRRKHISSLRPHCKPLFEVGYGCYF